MLLRSLLLLLFAPAAFSQELAPSDLRDIKHVIESQLEAFQRDDAETAFSFASPNIRKLFGAPANFMAMVKSDYQAVYRPRSVNFLKPEVIEGRVLQPVQVLGPDNVAMIAIYTMQRQDDGAWKIDGCELTPASGVYARRPVSSFAVVPRRTAERLAGRSH